MAGMIPFTDNYQDHSTRQGYQFEFFCERCGNGYSSSFKKSVIGFGGRLARIGGSFLGGSVGNKMQEVGYQSEWLTDSNRGGGHNKALGEAVAEVQEHFTQCHRCGQWVCRTICWNDERGLCVQCAPKLDQEIAGMQAAAQVQQLNEKIQGQDWTQNVNYRDQGTAMCPSCGKETGGGKFCASCGTALAAAPASTKKFCANCGTELKGAKFCAECGTAA